MGHARMGEDEAVDGAGRAIFGTGNDVVHAKMDAVLGVVHGPTGGREETIRGVACLIGQQLVGFFHLPQFGQQLVGLL